MCNCLLDVCTRTSNKHLRRLVFKRNSQFSPPCGVHCLIKWYSHSPSCSSSQFRSHPWLLSLPHSIYIITKSCQLCFQNIWWTDIFSPLLQLPPHANCHLIQTTAMASCVPALLHLHSFFSIQRPQWSFKNQLGLRALQRFPKDKISDPSVDYRVLHDLIPARLSQLIYDFHP